MNCDEMEQLIEWTEKINYIMNKTILKRVAFLAAACLVLFLVIVTGQTETQTSLELKTKEMVNLMAFAPYIENMKGCKVIDYSLAKKRDFASYADYQGYDFVTAEQVDQKHYEDYEFVLVGDENGPLGGVGYVGLLVHRESLTPCGHVINK